MANDFSQALDTNFVVHVTELPNLEFFLTDAAIPDIDVMAAQAASPYGIAIPLGGDEITYSPLVLGFTMDEHFHAYEELLHWIIPPNNYLNIDLSNVPKTDIMIDVLDNAKKPTVRFHFVDAFPVSLQGVTLDVQSSANPIPGTCQWRYSYFKFIRLQRGSTPPVTRREPLPRT